MALHIPCSTCAIVHSVVAVVYRAQGYLSFLEEDLQMVVELATLSFFFFFLIITKIRAGGFFTAESCQYPAHPPCTCCVYIFQSAAAALTVSLPFVCALQRPSRGPITPTTPRCACPSTPCAPATTWTSSSPSSYASTSSPWASSTTISHR